MQMTTIDAIRIPGDASASIRTAAAELARWIEKLGGTRPTILNRIEVGTIGRHRDESETKFGGGSLNGLGPMPGGAVPNDDDSARRIIQPFSHALESYVLCCSYPRSR